MREPSLVSHFSTTSDPGDVVTPPRLPPRKGLALALTTASPLLLLAPPRPALALAPAAAREGGGCRGGVHSPAAHNPAMRSRWAGDARVTREKIYKRGLFVRHTVTTFCLLMDPQRDAVCVRA